MNSYHHNRDCGFRPMEWNEASQKTANCHDPNAFLMGTELEYTFDLNDYFDRHEDSQLDPDWYDYSEIVDEIAETFEDRVGYYLGTESDCSVDDGFECVSEPMTLQAHLKSGWINRLADLCDEYDAEDGINGMHVHVNRLALGDTASERSKAIAKIVYMLDVYEDNFIPLARREYTDTGWAHHMDVADYSGDIFELMDRVEEFTDDRYYALNLTNYNTIEFRIFESSTSPFNIKSTFELVHALCHYAMYSSLSDIKQGSWYDFCLFVADSHYKYLPQYMDRCGCWTKSIEYAKAM